MQTNIPYEHPCRNPNKILANQIQQYMKRIVPQDGEEFISEM